MPRHRPVCRDLGAGRLEALYLAEEAGGGLTSPDGYGFGIDGRVLWATLDPLRLGRAGHDGVVRIEPGSIPLVTDTR